MPYILEQGNAYLSTRYHWIGKFLISLEEKTFIYNLFLCIQSKISSMCFLCPHSSCSYQKLGVGVPGDGGGYSESIKSCFCEMFFVPPGPISQTNKLSNPLLLCPPEYTSEPDGNSTDQIKTH